MGFFFFLSTLVISNLIFKIYKLRSTLGQTKSNELKILEARVANLELSLLKQDSNKRIERLEETVYFGDFELNRKFSELSKSDLKVK